MPRLISVILNPVPRSANPKAASHRSKTTPTTGERALIAQIRARAAAIGSRSLRLGIGDDCAILSLPHRPKSGHDLLVTTDFSLEGRHFLRHWHSPQSIGHRALARGLSDLAAMGAEPLAAFLSLALPASLPRKSAWLDGFLDGLLALAAQHGVPLAGGDTAESPSPHILADITLLGAAPTGRALRRSGARPGDLLYVTGHLGGAATELASLSKQTKRSRPSLIPYPLSLVPSPSSLLPYPLSLIPASPSPHLFPQPRLAVGRALLRRHLATACIDLSDGLSTDLAHLCDESTTAAGLPLRAEIDAPALPLHPLTQALKPAAALHAALHGGEDYELLFTARPTTRIPRQIAGVPLTLIGRICLPSTRRSPSPAGQLTLIDGNHRRSPLLPGGWEHLA